MSDGIFPNLSIQEHKSFLDFDTKPKFDGPDFVPDFSEKINIMSDSLNLALHTLNLPESEYKILSIQDLKSLRKIDTDCVGIWALNILIYYFILLFFYYFDLLFYYFFFIALRYS